MTDWNKLILETFISHRDVASKIDALAPDLQKAINICSSSLKSGGTILLCGNGGSAADAQHLAGELVGRFMKERKALSAQALHTNTTVLTAIGNDYSFDRVFARQVEAFGKKGDVLIGLTTSGNSSNILAAASAAKEAGMHVIGFTGESGGKFAPLCNVCLRVPSDSTPRIQEMHILLGHILCEAIEADL